MGRFEREVVAAMRNRGSCSSSWSTARLQDILYPSKSSVQATQSRQTYRALDRTSVVPDAIGLETFLIKLAEGEHRERVEHLIAQSRRRRMKISIIQLKEVRLGIWALCWNNLRMERHWAWIHHQNGTNNSITQVALAQLLIGHKQQCCLLFDESARTIFELMLTRERGRIAQLADRSVVLNEFQNST